MAEIDYLEALFISWAFLFQAILIIHFSLRKWRFHLVLRYGWIVYALGIPAAGLSIYLLLAGKNWSYWLAGILYLVWAAYGYYVEYLRHIQWRSPMRWSVMVPYVTLFLATQMFYWWPLALIYKPLWYIYGALFLINTMLNVTSHKPNVKLTYKEGIP